MALLNDMCRDAEDAYNCVGQAARGEFVARLDSLKQALSGLSKNPDIGKMLDRVLKGRGLKLAAQVMVYLGKKNPMDLALSSLTAAAEKDCPTLLADLRRRFSERAAADPVRSGG